MALLDPYIADVLDDQDRELLEEASAALEAGASRIAYIGVWLAVAESLRRKFVELAPRDDVAGRHLRDIEIREGQHKAVDVMLIKTVGPRRELRTSCCPSAGREWPQRPKRPESQMRKPGMRRSLA
jgi:hypothetical protein